MIATRLLLASCGVGFVALPSGVFAVVERVSVPFSVDEEHVFADMAIELERREVSMSLEQFSDAISSPSDQTFYDVVAMLSENDRQGLFDRSGLAPFENPEDRIRMIAAYQEAFGGLIEDLEIIASYEIGDRFLYVWSVLFEEGPYVRSFSIGGQAQEHKWVDSSSRDALTFVESILKEVEQYGALGSSGELASQEFRYDFDIPGSEMDLLFNGTVVRWDALGDEHPDSAVCAMYSEAFQVFKSGDMDGFASFYTAESGKRFLEWVGGMSDTEFDAYHASVVQEREVRFILEADPIYIVFCNTPSKLDYDVVYRDGDNYRLTNFYLETFIDDVFQSEELFVRPILLDVVGAGLDSVNYIARGVPPSQSQPVGAVTQSLVENAGEESADRENATEERNVAAEENAAPKASSAWLWLLLAVVMAAAFFVILKRKSGQK